MTGFGMAGFNWPALMHAGLYRLGLRPDQFWALTPAELLVMLGVDPKAGPMGRARLDDLLRAFPDDHKGTQHERDNNG